jgi:hypothetical protein
MVICKVECLGWDILPPFFFTIFCGVALILPEKDIVYTRACLSGAA